MNKALESGADAVVLDLEDAIAPQAKSDARRCTREILDARTKGGPAIIVRINAPDTAWGVSDLEVLSGAALDAIMVPKATRRMLGLLPRACPPVIGLVETAEGVEEAPGVAADPRVVRLMLGSADLAADVGSELRADELDLLYPRSRVAMASAAAGIEGPIDVVHLDVTDDDGLVAASTRSRSLGFTAKACIHPRQLGAVKDAFTPGEEDIVHALAVVEAYEQAQRNGSGVATVGTKFVDLPVLRRAQRTLTISGIPARPLTKENL
ncbi:HpcH/HpaI aldolase/citrate lyase family protein [Arthrobacter sp. MMS18-M83]|uniref:HpcH/HpaI aldolase/citrate lyase family protein n=1 Tax=Arthrobacter sp. MMS18-M83 TaxID=2996261 RepID=UPI00227C78BA|nr:CoA ester lyase [Arthrobacter sp. MMS18-M83]WAH97574.1 CoA ester lyase [Arthrobacter sp. MMS18-M83]